MQLVVTAAVLAGRVQRCSSRGLEVEGGVLGKAEAERKSKKKKWAVRDFEEYFVGLTD